MKPQKPNLLQRMKDAESAPQVAIQDVANLIVALRRGGLLALPGPDLANVSVSLARLEAVCEQHLPKREPPQNQPAEKPAEPSKG